MYCVLSNASRRRGTISLPQQKWTRLKDLRRCFDSLDLFYWVVISWLACLVQNYQPEVLDFIDEAKHKEKDKQSQKCKLLKLIWMVIINFERLRAPNATKALYSSNLEMLLTTLFQNRNISIESGESVSDATSRDAAALCL